jgi:hypothetical protein
MKTIFALAGILLLAMTATTATATCPSSPTITASGSTFCSGGSVTLTSSSSSGNQWYLNAAKISGATSQSYTTSTAGTYTVKVAMTGCDLTSSKTVVTVNSNPATPTIKAQTSTSFCSGGSVSLIVSATSCTGCKYQWYSNGKAISGATSNVYTASASGSYTAKVTNTNGCSATSAATVVTVNTSCHT